jgi:hypothetical protein
MSAKKKPMVDIFVEMVEADKSTGSSRDIAKIVEANHETCLRMGVNEETHGYLFGSLRSKNEKAIDDWNRKCAEQEREKD